MSGHLYHSFETDFARSLTNYLKGFGEAKSYFQLTSAEIDQLRTYQAQTDIPSPEVRNDPLNPYFLNLHFEVKRSLTRLFGLLCVMNDSYEAFIAGQPTTAQLNKDSFLRLKTSLNSLSEDEIAAIRATCFLSISEYAKNNFIAKDLQPNSDSEVFLTQLAANLIQYPDLMPVTLRLSSNQRSLLTKAYWTETHFRHLLFIEGGSNMVSQLVKGIKEGAFSKNDFQLWKWRWLTNLFGFKVGLSAQNYDAVVDKLSFLLIEELEELFTDPNKDFMSSYLRRLQKLFLLDNHIDLNESEKMYIAKIVMSMHDIKDIATSEGAIRIAHIYRQYKQNNPEKSDKLIELFSSFMKTSDIKTPTYMPAVLNGTIKLFDKDEEITKLLPQGLSSIEAAVMFQFHYSPAVYEKALSPERARVSCRLFASETSLKNTLMEWLENGMRTQFIISDKMELEKAPGVFSRFAP